MEKEKEENEAKIMKKAISIKKKHPEELRKCIGDFASAVEYGNLSLIRSISAAYKLADANRSVIN